MPGWGFHTRCYTEGDDRLRDARLGDFYTGCYTEGNVRLGDVIRDVIQRGMLD